MSARVAWFGGASATGIELRIRATQVRVQRNEGVCPGHARQVDVLSHEQLSHPRGFPGAQHDYGIDLAAKQLLGCSLRRERKRLAAPVDDPDARKKFEGQRVRAGALRPD